MCLTLTSLKKRSNARKILAIWKELTMGNKLFFLVDTYRFAWVEYHRGEYHIFHSRMPHFDRNAKSFSAFPDADFHAVRKTEFEAIWYIYTTTYRKEKNEIPLY